MKKILVVDDEPAIVTLLTYNLENANYEVQVATDGPSAFKKATERNFDFIILDLMLPGYDGIEVTKKLRQEKIKTPIIILTAKDDELNKIIGLEIGADDYMTKPFSPREVVARIKAILRRTEINSSGIEQDDEEVKEFKDFKIDFSNYSVYKNNEKVSLTPKEFELLVYFVKRIGRVLSREKLLSGVWGYDYEGQTRMIDMHVSHLREKLEVDPKKPVYLKTVRGFGYKFEENK